MREIFQRHRNGDEITRQFPSAWVVANNRMAAALKAKGYPYQFVFSEASGHVERAVEMQTMPEAFEWVWKGYKPAGR